MAASQRVAAIAFLLLQSGEYNPRTPRGGGVMAAIYLTSQLGTWGICPACPPWECNRNADSGETLKVFFLAWLTVCWLLRYILNSQESSTKSTK